MSMASRWSCEMSKTLIGSAVCWEFKSERCTQHVPVIVRHHYYFIIIITIVVVVVSIIVIIYYYYYSYIITSIRHALCQCVAPLATNSLHSDLSKAFCHTLCWSFLQQCCMLVYHMHCDIQTFVPDRCLVVQLNNVLKVFTFPTFNQPIVVLQHKTRQCYYFTELQWISPNTINFCTEKPSLFFTLTLKLLMFNIFLHQKFQKAAHSKSGKKMVKQQVLMYQEL